MLKSDALVEEERLRARKKLLFAGGHGVLFVGLLVPPNLLVAAPPILTHSFAHPSSFHPARAARLGSPRPRACVRACV